MYSVQTFGQNAANVTYVYGVLRQDANGVWFLQKDDTHQPMGIDSVYIHDNRVRILFDFEAASVGSCIITPDDALARKGYIVSGAGVGLSSAEFNIGKMSNAYGGAKYSNGTVTLQYSNTADQTIFPEIIGNAIRIHHDSGFGLIPAQLTPRTAGYLPQLGLFGDNYFDVHFYDYEGNEVMSLDQKCNFLFNRSGYRMIDVNNEILPNDGNLWVIGVMGI